MKKSAGLFIVSILALIALFSCVSGDGRVISVTIPVSISSAPFIILDGSEIGGYSLDVEMAPDSVMAMAGLVSGKTDILMTGFDQGLAHFQAGGKIIHLSTIVWGVSSLLAMEDTLLDLKDFTGKRILVPFAGSPLDIQLRFFMEQEKLSEEITVDYAPIQQMVPLLLTGKTDGICVPEPLVSRLVLKNNAHRVFSFPQKLASLTGESRSPQVSLFITEQLAVKKKAFLSALIRRLKMELENLARPGAAGTVTSVSEALSMDENIVVRGLDNTLFSLPDRETQIELIRWYIGLTGVTTPPGNDFYFDY